MSLLTYICWSNNIVLDLLDNVLNSWIANPTIFLEPYQGGHLGDYNLIHTILGECITLGVGGGSIGLF